MPAYATRDIRNIAIVGHGGSGKTTLAEMLVFKAGRTKKLGSVDAGTSIADSDPEEKARRLSIDPAVLSFDWKGKHFNLVDTPGYPDFIGGAVAGLSACDVALVVISVVEGIGVNTRRVWQGASKRGLGRIIVLTKLDAEGASFERVLQSIQAAFGERCLPAMLPVGQGASLGAVVDAWSLPRDLPAAVAQRAKQAHEKMIEAVVEGDDALLESYLDGKKIEAPVLAQALANALAAGRIFPVLCCSSARDLGVVEVLGFLQDFAPSPDIAPPKTWTDSRTQEEKAGQPTALGHFSGQVFRTLTDPFAGRMTFARIYSGEVTPEGSLYNMRTGRAERVGQITALLGIEQTPVDKAVAGDIICFPKLEDIAVSDTLGDRKEGVKYAPLDFPTPMVSVAASLKTGGDEQKLSTSLARLSEEDPTFRVVREAETRELVISGVSTLHLDAMLSRLKRRFGVELETRPPKVPYRETIMASAEAKYRHKKQTGGRGQYGEVYLRLDPLPRGAGFEFADEIFGGSIPNQYVPAVEKGVREALQKGCVAGYPVQDVRAAVFDGSYHPVDSSEAAFKIAAARAFELAMKEAKPVLLEPIVNVEITVSSQFLGDIAGDLTSRRGRILGMDSEGDVQIIRAQVPLSEMTAYATDLRSRTGGQGSFSMELSHYDPVPAKIAEAIASKAKQASQGSQ